jgi:predicted DNA-binding transcriptional regulator YafY
MVEDASPSEGTDVPNEVELLVRVSDAARMLGITSRSVRRRIQEGRLTGIPDGRGSYHVPASEARPGRTEEKRVRQSGRPTSVPRTEEALVPLMSRLAEAERARGDAEGEVRSLREERERIAAERDALRQQLEDATEERIGLERQNARLLALAERRPWWRWRG